MDKLTEEEKRELKRLLSKARKESLDTMGDGQHWLDDCHFDYSCPVCGGIRALIIALL